MLEIYCIKCLKAHFSIFFPIIHNLQDATKAILDDMTLPCAVEAGILAKNPSKLRYSLAAAFSI